MYSWCKAAKCFKFFLPHDSYLLFLFHNIEYLSINSCFDLISLLIIKMNLDFTVFSNHYLHLPVWNLKFVSGMFGIGCFPIQLILSFYAKSPTFFNLKLFLYMLVFGLLAHWKNHFKISTRACNVHFTLVDIFQWFNVRISKPANITVKQFKESHNVCA